MRSLLIDGKPLPATPEQETILDAVAETSDNITVVALAGAAKTRTLQAIAEELPGKRLLCLAFNKNIATEMAKKLPENCDCYTFNALAHRAFCRYLGKWPTLNPRKDYEIVRALDPGPLFHEVYEALRFSKIAGFTNNRLAKPLITFDELLTNLPYEISPDAVPLLQKAIRRANAKLFAAKAEMDFDEQILGAAVFPVTFPPYDVVLVDEAQDLSALNHRILWKLVKKRLILVGDPLQAIYAFRGAHQRSMYELSAMFHTVTHQLTISFRCAKQIVEEARWLATDMRPAPWAAEGIVETLAQWGVEDIKSADAILCRRNAPLFLLSNVLFAAGVNAEFVGHDIVQKLLGVLKSFGNCPAEHVRQKIDLWEAQKLQRSRLPGEIRDEANALRIVTHLAQDCAGMQAHLRRLRRESGRIKLMTIHRAKGLEFNTVFLLNPDLIGDEDQEPNLRYVAQTRAKQRLVYITNEGFRA